MENFSEILKQFTGPQKLIVSILMIVGLCGSSYYTAHLQGNSCRSVIEENKELVEGYVEMSKLVRELSMVHEPKLLLSATTEQMASFELDTLDLEEVVEMNNEEKIEIDTLEKKSIKPLTKLDSMSMIIDEKIGKYNK